MMKLSFSGGLSNPHNIASTGLSNEINIEGGLNGVNGGGTVEKVDESS